VKENKLTYYEPKEEKFNVISHAIGLVLSIVALVLLVVFSSLKGNAWHIVSFSIYGASLIVLYAASTFYHYVQNPKLRYKLNIFDHSAIYVLVSWGLAFAGIVLKLFFTGKYDKISTFAYVLMGWVVIFAIKPLVQNLPFEGLMWLLAGGIFYTVGAVLYSIKNLKYNHAIFHIFVLLGSFAHFIAVFFYVLPIKK